MMSKQTQVRNVMTKIRAQIQLDPVEHTLLKDFASRQGISVAAAVLMIIRQALVGAEPDHALKWDRFVDFAGQGSDQESASDVARHHDDYLYGKQ
jgi:hypothetical protein